MNDDTFRSTPSRVLPEKAGKGRSSRRWLSAAAVFFAEAASALAAGAGLGSDAASFPQLRASAAIPEIAIEARRRRGTVAG